MAEKIVKSALPMSPENRRLTEGYAGLFVEAWRDDFKKDPFWVAAVCMRAANLEAGDMVRYLEEGFNSTTTLAGFASLSEADRNQTCINVLLPRVLANGDDAPHNFTRAARVARIVAASNIASDILVRTKAQEERKESAAALDPVEDEVTFDQYGKLLAAWTTSHCGIELTPNKTPSRSLVALLTKMQRKNAWEPVTLDLCHPRAKYKGGRGTVLIDDMQVVLRGGVLHTARSSQKESKRFDEADFWTNLEVLKVAYHITSIVDENVFQLHIEDMRTKHAFYPKCIQEIMVCDRRIRAHWVELMLQNSQSLEEVVKGFSAPTSVAGTAFWSNLLFIDPSTSVHKPQQAPARPFPSEDTREKKKKKKQGGSGQDPPPRVPRNTDPFQFQKGALKICNFHAWKGNCRHGAACPMSHACPHEDCPVTETHSAFSAHPAEWNRVFPNGDSPFKGKGKGKGGGGKGKGKGRR